MDHEVDRTNSHRDWWRRQLAGLDAMPDLPADRPRVPLPSARSRRVELAAGGPSGCLANLDLVAARPSREVDTAVLLAGVAALCARLTGRDDLALGTSVSGPGGRPGLAVVRLRLARGTSFGELLTQARKLVREAAQRGPVPPDLAGRHDRRRHPLTQVIVTVRSAGEAAPDPAALRLTPEAPPFDLAWILDRSTDPATLILEHDPERFHDSGPALLRAIWTLLASGLGDPSTPLASLATDPLPTD